MSIGIKNSWEVLWLDESRISMNGKDGGTRVWRLSSEQFDPDWVGPTSQWSPGLMVWGCFAEPGLGLNSIIDDTLNGHGYTELIKQHVYPTMLALFDNPETCLFQDDNACRHRSLQVNTRCDNLGIQRLVWPTYSPDVNPIENLSKILKSQILARPRPPTTLPDLRVAIDEEWARLAGHHEIWRPLLDNIPARIMKVRISRSYPTKY